MNPGTGCLWLTIVSCLICCSLCCPAGQTCVSISASHTNYQCHVLRCKGATFNVSCACTSTPNGTLPTSPPSSPPSSPSSSPPISPPSSPSSSPPSSPPSYLTSTSSTPPPNTLPTSSSSPTISLPHTSTSSRTPDSSSTTADPTAAKNSNPTLEPSATTEFNRSACIKLASFFDGCSDPTLYYSRLGIAILSGCCGIKAKVVQCSPTSVHKPTPQPGSTTNRDGIHFRRPIRLLTPRGTLILALCGMSSIIVIAGFLYMSESQEDRGREEREAREREALVAVLLEDEGQAV